jgi:hypothetical protein
MAYKLLDAAQERWRRFNGHEPVADVLAGAKYKVRHHVITTSTDDGREGRRLISVKCRSTSFDIARPLAASILTAMLRSRMDVGSAVVDGQRGPWGRTRRSPAVRSCRTGAACDRAARGGFSAFSHAT